MLRGQPRVWDGMSRVIEVTEVVPKETNEPCKGGSICPDPGEYRRGVQPVGSSSSREYKTKLAGEVSGRHR